MKVGQWWAAWYRALAPRMTAAAAAEAAASAPRDQVVYHLSEAAQAARGLRNMRNHLDAAPETTIFAVANGSGVRCFLRAEAPAESSADAAARVALVQALMARGVRFEVCQVAARGQGLAAGDFIAGVGFTPSAVVRLTQLQTRAHCAYIKP